MNPLHVQPALARYPGPAKSVRFAGPPVEPDNGDSDRRPFSWCGEERRNSRSRTKRSGLGWYQGVLIAAISALLGTIALSVNSCEKRRDAMRQSDQDLDRRRQEARERLPITDTDQ